MLPNVTLTPAAAKFIQRVLRFSGLPPTAGFRLLVSPGGCSGYSSEFSAEAALQDGEQLLEVQGLRFFLPAQSRLLLDGATVDFVETPTQSGLSFSHPGQASCACSSAESAAPGAVSGVTKIDVGTIARGRPASAALAS